MSRKCFDCALYRDLGSLGSTRSVLGDCVAPIPYWIPSHIVQDYSVVSSNMIADDCNCFKKKDTSIEDDVASPSNPYR